MFYVMCSTYCVCMFLCLLYAPIHQNKFQVGVNLLGNKYYSDSDSDSDVVCNMTGSVSAGVFFCVLVLLFLLVLLLVLKLVLMSG